jgi:hypothetical protein
MKFANFFIYIRFSTTFSSICFICSIVSSCCNCISNLTFKFCLISSLKIICFNSCNITFNSSYSSTKSFKVARCSNTICLSIDIFNNALSGVVSKSTNISFKSIYFILCLFSSCISFSYFSISIFLSRTKSNSIFFVSIFLSICKSLICFTLSIDICFSSFNSSI